MDTQLPSRIGSLLADQQELKKLSLLIVGVGGIGCELLKVLCKMPIGSIHIIDMDTIEISNLNRQFLFKVEHKGQSKALVAKESIKKINPALNIEAHHKNIRELPVSYFKSFNYLIMALDNIQTRNYVNRIGVRLGIPTIDAGTLGFKGNVHLILPHQTKCYSCEPKASSQKSFPVCTIRMRPEKPIHCIVWAKMLFEVLFTGQEVNNDMKDLAALAQVGDENSILAELLHTEIVNIKNAKTDSDSQLAQNYIEKIKPIPLQILSGTPSTSIDQFDAFDSSKLGLDTLVALAKQSFLRLLDQKNKQGGIIFEKDDDNIIHFVSSMANLRMSCFSIQSQSFNQVKNMAGNIVPAIASTNSIVSGLQVIEMIKLLSEDRDDLRSYYVQNQNYKVRALRTEAPLPQCLVCSEGAQPVCMEADMKTTQFGAVILCIKKLLEENKLSCEYSVNLGSKELYNSEEPNEKIMSKSLLDISGGAFELDLVLTDEDSSSKICILWVIHSQELQEPTLTNTQQIKVNMALNDKKEAQSQEQAAEQAKEQSDSECGFVEVKDGQPDEEDKVQITQVRKPAHSIQSDNGQVIDKVEKRVKHH